MPFENQFLWASKFSSISKRALKNDNILNQITDIVSIMTSDYKVINWKLIAGLIHTIRNEN